MDKKEVIILGLVILLLIAGYFILADYVQKKKIGIYNLGVQDTLNVINNDIINSLSAQGYVPFSFIDEQNQTQQVNLCICKSEQK